MDASIEYMRSYLERLCCSFALELHNVSMSNHVYVHLPPHIEFYGSDVVLLTKVRDKTETYLSLLKSPCFSSTMTLHLGVPIDYSARPGTYSIDVGWFLELYRRANLKGTGVSL